jgi:hypothetical protein
MILESTQILYTSHHVNGGGPVIEESAPICATTGKRGYKQHAKNHPSVLWATESLAHYMWLCRMALCLVDEHNFRFRPKKRHSSEEHLFWLASTPPPGLIAKCHWTRDPPPAMPDEFKISEKSVVCYWAYYNGGKRERGLLKWSRRHTPHIFEDSDVLWD